MHRIRRSVLIRTALLPVAVLMAVSGASSASGSSASGLSASADGSAAANRSVSTTSAHKPYSSVSTTSAHKPYSYSMRLSSTSATIQSGGVTTTVISFNASRRLQGAPVDLSVTGLPDGVTATFSPPRPRVRGTSTLTLTTAPSSPAGTFTVTVGAIINLFSSDPIGTSTTFGLTIQSP
jgi:hypothetical protein